MSYLEFLARWYNLAFLALVAGGLAVGLAGRISGTRRPALAAALIVAGIIGLTWNGALHDFGLADWERRFPVILIASLAAGSLVGFGVARVRRLTPEVTGLAFTAPGLEGTRCLIVSRRVGPEPASGRARWTDEDGVMHVVRVHTEAPSLRFGRRVVLRSFDPVGRSYLAEAIPDRS